ncbi:MAG: 4-amino-4-deoxy-L-arabinose transferase-like glycosyltransferase [Verrucomicrobiales bacterium]|jgi:4-amino-4-deoxy-L-arabinose transferase-like glycosyltransferase
MNFMRTFLQRILSWIEKTPFLRLFVIFAVLRVVATIGIVTVFELDPDEDYYDNIARELLAGDGYQIEDARGPDLLRTPVYTYFLTGLFWISGEEPNSGDPKLDNGRINKLVFAAQIALDLLTAWLIFLTARRLLGNLAARLGMLFVLAYPVTAIYTGRYLAETLFFLLVIAFALFLGRALADGRWRDYALAGLMLGLGALAKPVLLYFVPMLPILALAPVVVASSRQNLEAIRQERPKTTPTRPRLRRFAALAAAGAIGILVCVPWMVRNSKVTGEFVTMGTSGGFSIWLGNNLEFDGRDKDELDQAGQELFDQRLREIIGSGNPHTTEGSKILGDVAKKSMLENPGASTWLLFRKCWRFWFDIYGPENKKFGLAVIPIQIVGFVLGVAGLILAIRRRIFIWDWLFIVLMMNGLHALVTSTMRYSASVMPLVLCLAAWFLVQIARAKPGLGKRAARG